MKYILALLVLTSPMVCSCQEKPLSKVIDSVSIYKYLLPDSSEITTGVGLYTGTSVSSVMVSGTTSGYIEIDPKFITDLIEYIQENYEPAGEWLMNKVKTKFWKKKNSPGYFHAYDVYYNFKHGKDPSFKYDPPYPYDSVLH